MSSASTSTPSSPTQTASISPISSEALAAAAERRTRQLPLQSSPAQLFHEHDRRQKFRRLIDPGIFRPNPKEQALSSLETLHKISENLLREPDNPKFQQFKPTNTIIKRDLVDPKGALEFAIELGFRPEVKNFQPYYRFNPRHMEDLKIGSSILKEFIDLENEKEARATFSKKNEKAAVEAAAEKVKLAYMDDRKTKMQRDEIERQARAARQAAEASSHPAHSRSPSTEVRMPGAGNSLSPNENLEPPPYEVQTS